MERLRRNRCCAGLPSRSGRPILGRHGPCRDANRVQCLSTGLFLLLLSLEESNQRTCGIGTHASIAAPLAVGFGAWGVCEAEKVCCTLHRNLTPSIEASFRTQPPIPRGAGFFSWGVTAYAHKSALRDANRAQSLSTGCSCCYFLWKKVTKELCGIGTHASIATLRAVGFGA
jgi:hypothetical protein